jgi:2-methylisocitrate lyase-like PEP mutase family enzyme
MKAPTKLRELMASGELVVAPGVFNGFSARLVEKQGFNAIYLGGGLGVAGSAYGFPDLGMITSTEMVLAARQVLNASRLPLLVDADSGYGDSLNVYRTVQEFEKAGVAGIHLEDQPAAKRCGYYGNVEVIRTEEMCMKLKTAIDAKTNKEFLIIARTDALRSHGIDEAISRCKRYFEAGADMVFVNGLRNAVEVEKASKELKGIPKLYNVSASGKAPDYSFSQFKDLGFQVVIYPGHLTQIAAKSMIEFLVHLKREEIAKGFENRMISFEEFKEIVRLPEFERLQNKYKL